MKTVYEDWQDRAEDFDALYEYASKFDNFDDFLASVTLEISDAEGKESNEPMSRVRLMTVHQAKGLEFPVVFVIGAADGLFPTQKSIDDGDIDEERRLFYVASTRAMDFLIISYPRVSAVGGNFEMRKASRFLEDIDRSCYDVEY
jgi:DNA helicase-2/ATP-dependent DNA helicase PcrA